MSVKSIFVVYSILFIWVGESSGSLKTVHIIFRHGEKNPDKSFMYRTDPYLNYTFPPYGEGELTLVGRQQMYRLGEALRKRYKQFIGDYYNKHILDAWCSALTRTQTSLQVLLAAIFPPNTEETFKKNLHWQPIPYQYKPRNVDKLLLGAASSKVFMEGYLNLYREGYTKDLFQKYDKVLKYYSYHTGSTINTTRLAYMIMGALDAEKSIGLELPEWTKCHWKKFEEFALEEINLQMATKKLRNEVVGELLNKILMDTENALRNTSTYKLHIYSAHDINIANVLKVLGLMETPVKIDYAGTILLEVHETATTPKRRIDVFYLENVDREFKKKANFSVRQFQDIINDITDHHSFVQSSSSNCCPHLQTFLILLIVFYVI